VHADIRQRVADLIELERLDDRCHDFHLPILLLSTPWTGAAPQSGTP
jgi:hypothetical protein